MTKSTESKWRALIAAQERSGVTVSAVSEARGIVPATMYWCRSRLGRRCDIGVLVPVEVVERDAVTGRRGSGVADFELQIDGVTTLRSPMGFDGAELRRPDPSPAMLSLPTSGPRPSWSAARRRGPGRRRGG